MRKVISEILIWIELSLEQPLSVSVVEKKVGYSRWHFQRAFREVTGVPLARYIRERRLCRAAIDLKMTNTSILQIAVRYNFDSHQSFNRRFKAHFGMSPSTWRSEQNWDFTNLSPEINLRPPELPKIIIREIESFKSMVVRHDIFITQEELGKGAYFNKHSAILLRLLSVKHNIDNKMMVFCNYFNHSSYDGFGVNYELAIIHDNEKNGFSHHIHIKDIEKGKYIGFEWKGTLLDYCTKVSFFYSHILPSMNWCRRTESDINIFDIHGNESIDENTPLSGVYLIPVN